MANALLGLVLDYGKTDTIIIIIIIIINVIIMTDKRAKIACNTRMLACQGCQRHVNLTSLSRNRPLCHKVDMSRVWPHAIIDALFVCRSY
jgi:hypothetical protein